MSHQSFPIWAIMFLTIIVPIFLTRAVRRGDRKRADRGVLPVSGALLAVKNRAFQSVILLVVGSLFAVGGVLLTLLCAFTMVQDPGALAGVLVGVVILGFAAYFLDSQRRTRRFRVDCYADHMVVQPLRGGQRTLALTEIGSFTHAWSNHEGIVVRDVNRKQVFSVYAINIGYLELLEYFEQRAPQQWVAFAPR